MKNLMNLNSLDRYLIKSFLLRFLQVLAIFSIVIFFINFIEQIDKASDSNAPIYIVTLMAFLLIPDFLNEIVPSLILFSGIITFFFFSVKSEITIMRSCGYSLWHISLPVASSAFILGIFWVLAFGPVSILMIQKFNSLERQYIKKEYREVVESDSGIWIKQSNLEKEGEEIIIQAKKVYKENVELNRASVWFINNNGEFYKKIDAIKMTLQNDHWLMHKAVVNDDILINEEIPEFKIPTDLEADFVIKKVVSNFENVKLFSIFDLPNLISSLKSAGFQSVKFKVYLNSLITKPILFVSMIFIACYFGINNFRNQNNALMIFFGMISGLGLYVCLSFIAALGSSKFLPVFTSTWVITFICFAIGVLLIYKKENV